jgi:adenosylcobinamide-phosphate guanylyltransferase
MRVVALIMAGGKGERFGKGAEKPMVKLDGKPFIQRIIKAVKESKKTLETYAAVTTSNPKTAKEAAKASVKVIITDGRGYHADLQQAVSKMSFNGPVLTISADLPLLTGEFLDEIIDKYEKSGKPALTVLVPVKSCHKYGLVPTSLIEHKGRRYAAAGINIIDGKRTTEEQPQEVVISTKPGAVFNINTPDDLRAAENYLLRSGTT